MPWLDLPSNGQRVRSVYDERNKVLAHVQRMSAESAVHATGSDLCCFISSCPHSLMGELNQAVFSIFKTESLSM